MFENIYQGKKVLVTGNTGFKGSWLTVWLLSLGADVYGISNGVPSEPSMFEVLNLRERMTYFEKDVRDAEAVSQIIAEVKPDFVFHLAAQPIVRTAYADPLGTISSNVMGTAHVLDALRLVNHPCVAVMITSDKAYDNVEWIWGYRENDRLGGKDPYSASKGAAEIIIRTYYQSYFRHPQSNVRVAVGRAGNVVGGGDWAANRLVPDCFRQWGTGQSVEIRNPVSTRPWQHVLEALGGYLNLGQQLATRPELNGEAYNFGPANQRSYTVREVLEQLRQNWTFDGQGEAVRYVENTGVREDGLLRLNCDKALLELNWNALLTIEELARLTARWYYAFYREADADMFAVTTEQLGEYVALAAERGAQWANTVEALQQGAAV